MPKGKTGTKFIFVTGGVLSGLGKGITAASLGSLLKARGLKVNAQKLDPYLNVDAGTLNPSEHGECFVTADGAETDLDLGHYERFLDTELNQNSSVMSGRLLRQLIDNERAGKFLGQTVQLIPHYVNSIKQAVLKAASGFDVHFVEIGGTVGDYESPAFFEAVRQLAEDVGRENCINLQVVYLPYLGASGEFKTKPAQNAMRDLRSIGILPDIVAARSESQPDESARVKISRFGGVPPEAIAILPNADSVYQVPISLHEQKIDQYVIDRLNIKAKRPYLKDLKQIAELSVADFDKEVTIGVVAKYLDNNDTYMSVVEALKVASYSNQVNLHIKWIDAEMVNKHGPAKYLKNLDGILVPGGFGGRGVEGKIKAAEFSIKNNIPYLGICLGLQVAVIAALRMNGLKQANSLEFDKNTPDPVIYIIEDQTGKEGTGGSMRLGDYTAELKSGSKVSKLYGSSSALERHRHRYEVNNKYLKDIKEAGLEVCGLSSSGLVEFIEHAKLKFFVATQAHPEFRSRPNKVHPLFNGFIKSARS